MAKTYNGDEKNYRSIEEVIDEFLLASICLSNYVDKKRYNSTHTSPVTVVTTAIMMTVNMR